MKKSLFQSSKGRSGFESYRQAQKEYRSAARASAKTERVAGVEIGGKVSSAQFYSMTEEQLREATQNILQERHKAAAAKIQGITDTTGARAHDKARMMFDLVGNGPGGAARKRELRKQLEGQESETALKSAADALSVSRELLEMWMSEGNTVSLEGDGKIIF